MIHLLNPNDSRILENSGDRVPIGLLSMARYGKKIGKDVRVFDLNHTEWDDYEREFEKDKPEVVGVSVYTSPIYPEALEIAAKLAGRTKLVAGGYHASAMPNSLSRYFDSVVVGEGETAMEDIEDTHRIFYINQDKVPIDPDREALEMSPYGINQDGKRTATMITSRGCPYSCSFCGNLDHKVVFTPLDSVERQIREIEKENFDAIYFLDDVFTLRKKRMEDILKMTGLPKRVTTRANLVDEEKADIMAESNVEWLSMGIESGNNRILKAVHKGMTPQDNYKAIRTAAEKGINVKGFFILGLPGETEQTAKQTINFARGLRKYGLTKADFYFLTPFPGTDIWRHPEKYGITLRSRQFWRFLEAGKGAKCYVDTQELKAERIEELVKEAKEEWQD